MAPEHNKQTTDLLPKSEKLGDEEEKVKTGVPEKSPFLLETVEIVDGQVHRGDSTHDHEKQFSSTPPESQTFSKQWRAAVTVLLFVTFLSHGLVVAIIGPTLLELEYYTGSSTKLMSTVFTWRYLGTLLGVISAGFLYEKFHPHLLMGGALLMISGLLSGAVWWTQLSLMCATFLIQGYVAGTVSVGTNVVCLGLWGKKSGPYLQFLHLFATVGASLAPQLAKPFLNSNRAQSVAFVNCKYNNTECLGIQQEQNITQPAGLDSPGDYEVFGQNTGGAMKFQYAYMIAASFQLLMSVMHLIVFCYSGSQVRKSIPKAETCTRKQDSPAPHRPVQVQYMSLFVLLSAFNGALEDMAGGLLVAFVVKYLGMEETRGTDLVTLLFGCISGGRAIAVLISKYVRPSYMLSINMVVLVACSAALNFTTPQYHLPLWICTAGIGFGLSSSFPCAIHWASTIIQASGVSTSAFFSGLFIGKMVGPPILGYMFDELSPRWYIYSILIGSVGMATVHVIICVVRLCHKQKYVRARMSVELPSLHVNLNERDD